MNIRTGLLLAVACASGSLLAYDCNSVAFYSFNEGTAGETVVGKAVVNALDGTVHAGTVSLREGGQNADLVYDDDAPGKYLFDQGFYYGKTPVCTDPKSIRFCSATKTGSGALIEFADLASEMSGDSWTVEFFFKIGASEKDLFAWATFLSAACGMGGKGANSVDYSEKSLELTWNSTSSMFNSIGEVNNLRSYISQQVADDTWHHFAAIFDASKKTFTAYLDYGNSYGGVTGDQKGTNIHSDPTTGNPLKLNGNFHGKICGLRVSKKALALANLLRASDEPGLVPRTAFHLSLDGVADETATALAARVGVAGEAIATPSGCTPPAYAAAVPNAPKYSRVTDGTDETYGSNVTSVAVQCFPSANFPAGAGFRVPGPSIPRCDGGDFTLESFVKCDWAKMTDAISKCTGTVYQRVTIFGSKNTGSNFDLCLSAELTYDRYKIAWYDTGNAYHDKDVYGLSALKDGKWHHFALSYDAADMKMRLDIDYGSANGGQTTEWTLTADFGFRQAVASRDMMFGSGLNNGTFYGWFDEPRFTHAVLAPEEYVHFGKFPQGLLLLFK